MLTSRLYNFIKTKVWAFLKASGWGAAIGLLVWLLSSGIWLALGTFYASSTEANILKEVKAAAEASQIAPPIVTTAETTNDRQLARTIEELDKTKEDLKQTKATLKAVTDNISEHFISNYRDTITVVGTGLGIVAALLSGLIAWGYGLVKEGLTKKIKQETEALHASMVQKSESRLSYLIYKNLSYAFYRYYRVILHDPDHAGFKGGTELASWFAERTISHAFKGHEGEERDNLVSDAKLHLLYHNSCRSLSAGSPIGKKDLLDEAARHFKNFTKSDPDSDQEHLYSRDTIAWIFLLWGDGDLKQKAIDLLKSIWEDPATTVAYRKELEENYEKRGVNLQSLLSGTDA